MAKKAILRTRQSGLEHAFVICKDGKHGKLIKGEEDRVSVDGDVCERGPITIFHTHPNGTLRLSPPDREVLSHPQVESVCVATPDGKSICETSQTCETTFDV